MSTSHFHKHPRIPLDSASGSGNRIARRAGLTGMLVLSLALPLMSSPAFAQLHGNWPNDERWSAADDRYAARSERVAARPSNNELNVPRGDLRKDVYDASRAAPHGPQR